MDTNPTQIAGYQKSLFEAQASTGTLFHTISTAEVQARSYYSRASGIGQETLSLADELVNAG